MFKHPVGNQFKWWPIECINLTYLNFRECSDQTMEKRTMFAKYNGQTRIWLTFDTLDQKNVKELRATGCLFAKNFVLKQPPSKQIIYQMVVPESELEKFKLNPL